MKITVDPAVEVPSYTTPGMYPLYYITADAGSLCPDCVNDHRTLCADANDPQWYVTLADINYEHPELFCDHCGDRIFDAYDTKILRPTTD